MKRYILCLCIILSTYSTAFASYVVKGKGITSVMYIGGKAETSKCNDEVVYVVDLENKIVTRTGVFNADIKEGPVAGLQTDNTVYQIVYDVKEDAILRDKERSKPQHIIKAIGKCGFLEGYETIVIGDDFISTSKSAFDYFMLYYYKRIQ
ncbi:MAG: hypothetical protein L6308_01125 [Candidatus Omnitrophica bacterium]|nr:hypothetical protein [Candidatus Omnitrophota bacterium]